MEYQQLRICPNCEKGIIVPLEDFGGIGSPQPTSFIKAWHCTHCDDGIMLVQSSLVRQRVQGNTTKDRYPL